MQKERVRLVKWSEISSSYSKKNSQFEDFIPKDFVLWSDPIILCFTTEIYPKDPKMESIKGTYDNRQITATFTVSMAVKFLIIQITYEGETRIYSPSLSFLINSMSASQMTSGQIRISLSSFPKNLYFHDLKKWKKASNILQSRCH